MQFEEVLKDNERIIHHLIKKYGIRDEEGDFFQEGLIALWHAVQTFDPSKSKLSTHIYRCISHKFLNIIKVDNREKKHLQTWLDKVTIDDLLVEDDLGIDPEMLRDIRNHLSTNQWCWLVHFVIQDKPIREIAKHYSVSEHAVKNWGRHAKLKIKQLLKEKQYV